MRYWVCLVFATLPVVAWAQVADNEFIQHFDACRHGDRGSCVELVRLECSGASSALPPELNEAYQDYRTAWRSLSRLEQHCQETWRADFGHKCQAAALIYQTGCGVGENRGRAHELYFGACERGDERSCELLRQGWCANAADHGRLETACDAGDSAACRERARIHYNGCRLVDDAAVLGHGCEAGDVESCRQTSILTCRGGATLRELPEQAFTVGGWTTIEGDASWERCRAGDAASCFDLGRNLDHRDKPRACSFFQRACAGGEWRGCGALVELHRLMRPAYDRDRSRFFGERMVELRYPACAAGELNACFEVTTLGGMYVAGGPRATLRARGIELCGEACDTLSGEKCRDLTRGGSRYALYDECRKAVLQRAVTRFEEECQSGELASCVEVGRTYHRDMRYESKARAAYDSACDAGSEEACEELRNMWNPNGVTFFFGGRYGRPFGGQFSFSAIIGRKADGGGGGHTVFVPSFVGGQGWLVQTELGPDASKLSLGWGRMVGFGGRRTRKADVAMTSPLTAGWAFKASVVRAATTNDVLSEGKLYVGGEVDVALGLRLTVGIFQGIGSESDTLLSWGIGVGF